MKILLILLEIGSQAKWAVGVSFLSAVSKEAGYQVELLEIKDKKEINSVVQFIKSYQPQIIGLSANSHQYIYAVEVARQIKSEFNILLFLGGVHPTIKPEEVIQEKSFDGVCIGEGEDAFLELIERIEKGQNYSNVSNFWFRKGEKITKNNIGPLVNLDQLPFPDYSIFKYYKEAGREEIVPRFIFSRGCPFNCTYCCNHVFRKIYADHGRYLRFRSVDKAIEEISLVKKQYNFKHFKIDDDIFSLNKNWVLEFCDKYSKEFDMSFECNVRIGAIDKETLSILKKAGCNLVKVGLETGNETLRKEILGRNISNQEVIELFELAKEIGILTFSFNMIGIPGETKQTIKETIDLNAKIKPDFMQVTAFYPYPGTILGEKCLQEGLIAKEHIDSYMEESVLELPNLTSQDIKKAVRNFTYNVYKQYNLRRALKEKKNNLKKFIISNPFLSKIVRPIYRLVKK